MKNIDDLLNHLIVTDNANKIRSCWELNVPSSEEVFFLLPRFSLCTSNANIF
jgi:hypothetical protein